MLANLKAEMARKGITAISVSRKLGIGEKTMSNKVLEKNDFTRKEMFIIHKTYFPEFDMRYLFDSDTKIRDEPA